MPATNRLLGKPHPALRDLLVADGYSGTSHADPSGPLLVPAEASVSWIFNLTGGGPGGFVTGAGGPYLSGGAGGPRAWATLTLTPLGAYQVIGPPVRDIGGRVVDLADLFGVAGQDLSEATREARGWVRRFALMDRFLLARAEHGRPPSPEVAQAWRRMVATGGRIPIGPLAAEVGWSHKRLIRRFHEQLGRPPKTLARILRFKSAVRRVRRDGRWERAVFDAGYYDQSHFIRDLRDFTGTTPTAYLAGALPCGCLATAGGNSSKTGA